MEKPKKIEIWPVADDANQVFVWYMLEDGYTAGGKYSHQDAVKRVAELLTADTLGGPVMATDLIKDEADG